MLAIENKNNTNNYDISDLKELPEIKVRTRNPHVTRFSAKTEKIKDNSADAIRDRDVFEKATSQWMSEGNYYRVLYVLFGANSGLRYSDIVSLRVCDVTEDDGSITDGFCLIERKTSARRSVWFNSAMKEVLAFIIKEKSLQNEDFIFRSDGNRTSYFKEFKYNKDGDIIDVVKTGEKFDENGNARPVAPIANKTACEWWFKLHDFGAEGKLSSHSARNTFRYFSAISGVSDEGDIALASQCMAHSSVAITEKHYSNITENMKKRVADSINLGLNAFREALEYKF